MEDKIAQIILRDYPGWVTEEEALETARRILALVRPQIEAESEKKCNRIRFDELTETHGRYEKLISEARQQGRQEVLDWIENNTTRKRNG